jgi:hypothetical protein
MELTMRTKNRRDDRAAADARLAEMTEASRYAMPTPSETTLALAHERGAEWLQQMIAHHAAGVAELKRRLDDYNIAVTQSRNAVDVLSGAVSDLNNLQRNCRFDLVAVITAAIATARAERAANAPVKPTHYSVQLAQYSDCEWHAVKHYDDGGAVFSNRLFDSKGAAVSYAKDQAQRIGIKYKATRKGAA